jgi:two-component system, chemotaxis family, sensor kinase CheA
MFDEETQLSLLKEFFLENRESLDQIEKYLLQLESNPDNHKLLNIVFRNMHTVKGNCQMMGFDGLESLLHEAETLLDLMRNRKVAANQEISTALLTVVDSTRRGMDNIETHGIEEDRGFSEQINQLTQLSQPVGSLSAEAQQTDHIHSHPSSNSADSNSTARLQSIRLSITQLDDMMHMVGETSNSFNQLRQAFREEQKPIEPMLEELGEQIHQLHGKVLNYRLQPIGQIWESYHRLVRDLTTASKKRVLLEIKGEETKVDRNILLAIKDILGHLIRNAIDHGIETPKERENLGKPPLGKLYLSAKQQNGHIIMQLQDNGKGIDGERVRAIALEKGLITIQQSHEMQPDDLLKFIFIPGFSTAAQVSRISGRGTGMDVVKTAIESVGGTVSLTSKLGEGSTITLKIPQTTALIPTMMVWAEEKQYALPQVNIVELITYSGREIQENIAVKMHTLAVQVRERLLPVIRLKRVVDVDCFSEEDNDILEIQQQQEVQMVILYANDFQFALEVDKIGTSSSIMVKPFAEGYSHPPVLTGSAIMPDGSVTLLINVSELTKS